VDGLTEGRIVHFVMPDGQHRAAIVVNAFQGQEDAKPPVDGMCNLMVFLDRMDHGFPFQFELSCPHSQDKEPGTWHKFEYEANGLAE
jgi:hypothetical protein